MFGSQGRAAGTSNGREEKVQEHTMIARHETRREAELVHKGQQPLISETTVNMDDEIRLRRDSTR